MNTDIRNLIIAGGALGVGYLIFNSLTKTQEPNSLSLKETQEILQEVKHQIIVSMYEFVMNLKSKLFSMSKMAADQKEAVYEHYKTVIVQIYEQKEKQVLTKYYVEKSVFENSLKKYHKDPVIKHLQSIIIETMDRAIEEKVPDLSVHDEAKRTFSDKQLLKLYESLTKMSIKALINKYQTEKTKDPFINLNEPTVINQLIGDLNLYKLKKEFFLENGFKLEWGHPNEVFFKLTKVFEEVDENYKLEMSRIEKRYFDLLNKVTEDPFSFDISNIDEWFANKEEAPSNPVDHAFNINSSTKSEPPIDEDSKDNELEVKAEIVKSNSLVEGNEDDKKELVNVDDVPNDAKELQKLNEESQKQEAENATEIVEDNVVNEIVSEVVREEKVKETNDEPSNVSLDGSNQVEEKQE